MTLKGHSTTSGSRYESFQDEIDEDYNNHVTGERSGNLVSPYVEFMGNGGPTGVHTNSLPMSSSTSSSPQQPKRIRLRAVESEREYFLKLMNVDLFRKLVMIQIVASLVIVISQVSLEYFDTKHIFLSTLYDLIRFIV